MNADDISQQAGAFTPIVLRGQTIRNRIWLAPMCQFSCWQQDGMPTDWHLVHLGGFAAGGFGLVMAEATAVSPAGRLSVLDAGLWSDGQGESWARVTQFIRSQGATPAVQLAHAGRKGSVHPSTGLVSGSLDTQHGAWRTMSSTARAYAGRLAPEAMTHQDIASVVDEFAAAARRAISAGFDVVEIHAAHGYLLHQFLSPAINDRRDDYGGSFDGRIRFLLEVVDAVRVAIGARRPLLVRLSATDWVAGGWDVEQTVELARILAVHGVDLVDVSSGGAVPEQEVEVGPGYQVDFAHTVRRDAGVAVGVAGLITEARQVEAIVSQRKADVVLIGREALRNPAWPMHVARTLGIDSPSVPYPVQHAHALGRPSPRMGTNVSHR